MIPYGRQDVTQADIDAVVGVLRSDFLTQGPAVPRFEERVAAAARGSQRRSRCSRGLRRIAGRHGSSILKTCSVLVVTPGA